MRVIIPIKIERREIAVRIPAQYAGHSFTVLKKYKLLKDEWQNDGSLVAVVEIPAGLQDDLFSELNKISHGEVESKNHTSIRLKVDYYGNITCERKRYRLFLAKSLLKVWITYL